MTRHTKIFTAAVAATVLANVLSIPIARADIFQWEYVNPANPSLGKQPGTMLAPGGAGVSAVPGVNLSGRNLTKAYLIGADLMGMYAEFATLNNAELSRANLTNATFTVASDDFGIYDSELTGANLTQANLTNAHFNLATLTGANFSRANLTNAHFDDVILTGANLTGAEVRGANFTQYNSTSGITPAQLYSTASYQAHDLTGIGLAGNNLAGINLAGQNLSNAKFRILTSGVTNLTGANLSQSNLTNADLSNTTLTNADLTGATVPGAAFRNITAAQLYSTASYQAYDLRGIKLSGDHAGINLARQNLANADFHGATLASSNFSQANLINADFSVRYDPQNSGTVTDLTGTNLSQSNFMNANFSGYSYKIYDEILGEVIVVIPGANLTGANLSGADARGANFQYATLAGVTTNNLIQSNGHIAGLDLTSGASLVVRNYHGNPATAPPGGLLPIVVEQHLAMDATGTLRLVFDADRWDSPISFAPGIPVSLGGTLDLTFALDVDLALQTGRTFDVFNWAGVARSGAFAIRSPYTWNVSNLYSTGQITLASVPEPGAGLMMMLIGAYSVARRGRRGKIPS